jgi:hypothetical protein
MSEQKQPRKLESVQLYASELCGPADISAEVYHYRDFEAQKEKITTGWHIIYKNASTLDWLYDPDFYGDYFTVPRNQWGTDFHFVAVLKATSEDKIHDIANKMLADGQGIGLVYILLRSSNHQE